jgi:hypothetical protein
VACCIKVTDASDSRTISVAGHLGEAHVADLMRACAASSVPVVVDLVDVLSVDRIAVEALRRLRAGGATLARLPKYLQFTLDENP